MYAVQVCMPGQVYRTITTVTANLSDKFDVYMSIVRGTHKLSRKGLSVRLVRENPSFDFNHSATADYWGVVKRVRIAA